LVENRDFFHTLAFAFDAPLVPVGLPFGTEKLEWCGYTDGGKSLKICLAVSIEHWRVTDKQTDRQTDR